MLFSPTEAITKPEQALLNALGESGRIGWMMAEDQFPFRL
jgi:hypothetical protein